MTFSQEWEAVFAASTHISIWPWTDLVSYVHRYARPVSDLRRVLELGCGVGANIPFFLNLGVDYHAVEGSATAVSRIHEHYPRLREKVAVGDFTQAIPFDGLFDLIVDRAATTSNDTNSVRRTIGLVYERLRPGARLIGVDWYSAAHSDASRGVPVDEHTRRDLTSRQFTGLGAVHFFAREHLVELLSSAGFCVERLEHKTSEALIPEESDRFAAWNFVAVKPSTR